MCHFSEESHKQGRNASR